VAALPALDLVPGPLVDGVVDGDYRTHVWGRGVICLAAHGLEKHLLRGIDPIACSLVGTCVALVVCGPGGGLVGKGAWDGADFAVGAEPDLGENACAFGWRGCGALV